MNRELRVAVVGCGTAGAAAALFLRRAGHTVTIFECVPDPGPVGAGITLQPTGQAVLRWLGLYEPVAARGVRIDRLICRTVTGRVVVDLEYAAVDPGLHGLGLHRGVLFQTLFKAVTDEGGIVLRCGVEIVGMRLEGPVRWLTAKGGERLGPFDLVVVADGRSASCTRPRRSRSARGPIPGGRSGSSGRTPSPSTATSSASKSTGPAGCAASCPLARRPSPARPA